MPAHTRVAFRIKYLLKAGKSELFASRNVSKTFLHMSWEWNCPWVKHNSKSGEDKLEDKHTHPTPFFPFKNMCPYGLLTRKT